MTRGEFFTRRIRNENDEIDEDDQSSLDKFSISGTTFATYTWLFRRTRAHPYGDRNDPRPYKLIIPAISDDLDLERILTRPINLMLARYICDRKAFVAQLNMETKHVFLLAHNGLITRDLARHIVWRYVHRPITWREARKIRPLDIDYYVPDEDDPATFSEKVAQRLITGFGFMTYAVIYRWKQILVVVFAVGLMCLWSV